MKRILAPTDFSGRSDIATARAISLCRQFEASLHLLHVVDDEGPAEDVERAARRAEERLGERAARVRAEAGIRPETAIATGEAFHAIIEKSDEQDADLIVMGAFRKAILRNVFVGTTVERVMRMGQRPVLMVNRAGEGPYRSVMVATDMSEHSGRAIDAAKQLGFLDAGHVSFVHAFESLAKDMMIYVNIEPEEIEKQLANEVEKWRGEISRFLAEHNLGDLRYDIRLEPGRPFHAIMAVVKRGRPDVLVIGTRGHRGLRHMLLGSVADALLRSAECDVLAIPPRRA